MKEKHSSRIPRSVWLPLLLLIYLVGMTIWFAPSLVAEGETGRLVATCIIELAIIVLIHILLKKVEARKKNGE